LNAKNASPSRFVAETRLTMGRADFELWLAGQVDVETQTALYNRDPANREIAAGRAQVWREIQALFHSK
jgi:hypothetical protein